MVHQVLEVLVDRHTAASRFGARADGHRLALVIEGGGSRAAYSTGMIGVLDEFGLTECFDAVYGSSAGALNGAWLLDQGQDANRMIAQAKLYATEMLARVTDNAI